MGRKGELKGELPGATALKTDKKEERRVGKPKPLHPLSEAGPPSVGILPNNLR